MKGIGHLVNPKLILPPTSSLTHYLQVICKTLFGLQRCDL